MLKTMRKHASYFYVLFVIVILSFIFWGVGNVDKSSVPAVVEIGKDKITAEEYWHAYDQLKSVLRDTYKEKFDEDFEKKMDLKDTVLDSLITDLLLSRTAAELGIAVTDKELQDVIMHDRMFVRDGVFNKDVYFRWLQVQRQTPEMFENDVRHQLLSAKMRDLIWFSADVNPLDIKNIAGDDKSNAEKMQAIYMRNRNEVIDSYVNSLAPRMHVKINKDLIS